VTTNLLTIVGQFARLSTFNDHEDDSMWQWMLARGVVDLANGLATPDQKNSGGLFERVARQSRRELLLRSWIAAEADSNPASTSARLLDRKKALDVAVTAKEMAAGALADAIKGKLPVATISRLQTSVHEADRLFKNASHDVEFLTKRVDQEFTDYRNWKNAAAEAEAKRKEVISADNATRQAAERAELAIAKVDDAIKQARDTQAK
jgi:hypothetical protein